MIDASKYELFSHNSLIELHSSLEEDLTEAQVAGQSLGQWRMAERLRRNDQMREEIRSESTRVLAKTITSPIEHQRGILLDKYLDKVSVLGGLLMSKVTIDWQVVSGIVYK